MATIGDLKVSSIEEAFGINPGDLKPVCDNNTLSELLVKNDWTYLENRIVRITRLEVIKSTFISNIASIATRFGGPVFDFVPGGKSYDEYLIYNRNRLYNIHVH